MLQSGHMLHWVGTDDIKQWGVRFIVHKRHIPNLTQIRSLGSRVTFLLKINIRFTKKKLQVSYDDEEIDKFYDDVTTALQQVPTHCTQLMGETSNYDTNRMKVKLP